MVEKEKSGKHVAAAFKRALEDLGGCFERLCGEVAELERGRADHEGRLQELEAWRREVEIQASVAARTLAAKGLIDKRIPDLEGT
jgi:hypothetical protein